jgi:hypothetical protein
MRKIARLLFMSGIIISTFFAQQPVNAEPLPPKLNVISVTELYCGTTSGYIDFQAKVTPGDYSNIWLEWPAHAVYTASVNGILDFSTQVPSTGVFRGRIRWTVNPADSNYGLGIMIALIERRQVGQFWIKVSHDDARFTINCQGSQPDTVTFHN